MKTNGLLKFRQQKKAKSVVLSAHSFNNAETMRIGFCFRIVNAFMIEFINSYST
jgi:hypothetical protein